MKTLHNEKYRGHDILITEQKIRQQSIGATSWYNVYKAYIDARDYSDEVLRMGGSTPEEWAAYARRMIDTHVDKTP